jgi:hypothetical protein
VVGAALLLVLQFERDQEVAGGGLDLEDQATAAADWTEEVAGVDQGVVGDGQAADGFELIDTAAGAEFGGGQDSVALFVSRPTDRASRRTQGCFDGGDVRTADELTGAGEFGLGCAGAGDREADGVIGEVVADVVGEVRRTHERDGHVRTIAA